MKLEHFSFEVEDSIALVTFNRPPVNAQNRRVREEYLWIFDVIGERDDIRVAILTGFDDVFSAGADIKERAELLREPGSFARHNRITHAARFAAADCVKPVICAINGYAIGAGFGMAFGCDILLASENVYAQMLEVDRGLAGGTKSLGQYFPRQKARMLYLTGEKVSAAELYRLGVVEEVLPREQLMDRAFEIARVIAAKNPDAVQRAKAAFNTVQEMPFRDAYRWEQTVTHDLASTKNVLESQAAFLEKRAPSFAKE